MSPEAHAWLRGFLFGYYLERGYTIEQAHIRSDTVPSHLIDDVREWNPFT